jgi:hypothetical protein
MQYKNESMLALALAARMLRKAHAEQQRRERKLLPVKY